MAITVETGTVASISSVTGTDSSYVGYVITATKRIESGSDLATLDGGIIKKNAKILGSFSAKDVAGVIRVSIMNVPPDETEVVSKLVNELVEAVQPKK